MGNFFGLDDRTGWKTFLFRWLGLSLLFHMVTAVFSVGHHSADEYFQILEFLSYRLGKAPATDLPVEFHEQMRPWMQPGIYFCITRCLEFLGIQSPFHWAAVYRAFSGFLGWLSVVGLALCSRFWFSDARARKLAVISLALIWFYPALHVRPSSESLAGSSFLIALSLAYLTWRQDHRQKIWGIQWLIVGALLGFSFEFRFQMGLMICGMVGWLLFYGCRTGRLPFRSMGFLFLGGGIVFLIGRWVDNWGYGRWVFSPWNYFSYNLIRGEVSRYGIAPWWDIFRMSMTETWPVLGFIIAISTVIAWLRHPKHILTWSQVPFFLVHEMIAHKECRFFFPIASAGPVLLMLSLYSSKTHRLFDFAPSGLASKLWHWSWKFLAFNNCFALVVLMFTPFARTVQFYEGVYHNIPEGSHKFDLYFRGRDPYLLLGNPVHFYRPPQLVLNTFTSYAELKDIILKRNDPLWLFDSEFHLSHEADPVIPLCHVVYRTLPPFVEKINWGNWLERTLTWTLYRCENSELVKTSK